MVVGKWETCFWFSTFPSLVVGPVWNVGMAAISKDCGKRGLLSISPSFPQAGFYSAAASFSLSWLLDAITGDVELEDYAVVHRR